MILKREHERAVDVVENLRGGKLSVTISNFLSPEEAHGLGRGFSVNTLPPGASIGVHRHSGDFEVYLMLGGEAVVTGEDGAEQTLRPQDMLLCEDGEQHSIENRTDAPVSFLSLILYTPAA